MLQKPSTAPLPLLIKHCIASKLLHGGRLAHSSFLQHGSVQQDENTLVQNLLIQLYSRCDALDDAHATFQAMEDHNVFSWTILMGAYAEHEEYRQALLLFRRMVSSAVTPNRVTFITVVSACAHMEDIAEGQHVHACIQSSPCACDTTLCNALASMYDRCGSLGDACSVFGGMPRKNAISWNTMISAYGNRGHGLVAIQLFHQMLSEDVLPDKVSYVNVLDVYAGHASLLECKRMHVRIVASGFELDVVLSTAIVCMYGKHGSVENAWTMFDLMPDPNIVSWNAILACFEELGRGKDVIQLLQQMRLRGSIPDKVTCVTIFTACTTSSPKEGEMLHSCILCCEICWDLILWNALINMYGGGGMLDKALALFEEMPTRDVVSWNGAIAALAHHECGWKAIQLFQQMQLECVLPNKVSLVSTVDACASEATISEGRRVHARIVGCGSEGEVVAESNALLNMYGKCGRIEHARDMFEAMQHRDVISWSSLAATYAQHGYGAEALRLLDQMRIEGVLPNNVTYVSLLDACASRSALSEGKAVHAHICDDESSLVIGNALVNMYSKCHSLPMAKTIFDGMRRRDVVSWTAMSSAYAQEGYHDVALRLFFQMQEEGVHPNSITYISILDALGNQAALAEGQAIHGHVVENDSVEVDLVEVDNAIMSMYGKCGCLEDAQRAFDRMPGKNVVTWTTMISSYSQYGMGKKAYKLYERMLGADVKPNRVTLLSVLTACSHAGLIEEGCLCFHSMCHEHGIAPTIEHYNCVVDLFARAGKVEEGIDVILKMPMGPVATTWMTVLAACKMHLDLERAVFAAEKLFELDPKNATPYILLSNTFADAGRCEDAEHVRAVMLEKGLEKPLACSSVMVKGKTYEFYSGDDDAHGRYHEIRIELENLEKLMKMEGYVTHANPAMPEDEAEEEEEDPPHYYHSEKLAVGFCLISTLPRSPLLIRRNLRVCDRCHTFMMYVSRATQRQIVVNDGRFSHRFKDGRCTCADDS